MHSSGGGISLSFYSIEGNVHMKVIDINQRSNEWHDWRKKGLTASDLPIILGLSPYKTPWQLWAEKVGKINPPDLTGNPHVQRGVRLEDEARQQAEARYNEILLPLCGECSRWDILRASFDGLDSEMTPYEFKAPSDSVWNDIESNGVQSSTYKLYEAQVQTQCVVAGAKRGRLIFYKEDSLPLEFEISLSSERENEILEAAKTFWEQVITNHAPETDPERDWYIPEKGNERFRWEAQADAWRSNHDQMQSLKEKLKILERDQKAIQKELIEIMGEFRQADVGGLKVTRFSRKGTIDYTGFLKATMPEMDPMDLEPFRKASSEEARFSKSEDELVNRTEVKGVITPIKSAYF
jgi:putative phage-type endonuclease